MERFKRRIYISLCIGILIFTAILSPTTNLTLAQRVASVIPENIRAYDVLELDGAALRAEVEAGRTITLTIAGRQFELRLALNNMFDPEYAAQNGITAQDISTFRGRDQTDVPVGF